jgi:DNA-binding NtrC family response regulator
MVFEKLSILIVEDSEEELEKYMNLSTSCKLNSYGASSLEEAKQLLSLHGFDLLLTDIHLNSRSDGSFCDEGLAVIKYALETQPQLTVLAMSHDIDRGIFEKSLTLGVTHFFRKPITSADEILIYIKMALQKKHALNSDKSFEIKLNKFLNEHSVKIYNHGIIISSKQDRFLSGVAKNKKIPLMLFGETGTGKEEFAKILHKKRVQVEGMIPFVTVNCPLLDNDLTSSLLFGHKKGAFTGANETTNGYVAAANGGILFLDEVHTLDLATQRKLLRVLNDGSYNRVGDMRNIHSYFQLIVATTKDLDEEVELGRMLADFKYRISGAELVLDPLRERLNELPLFIAVFFKREGIDVSENLVLKISQKCEKYQWKGNIRQLFRILQRMLINSELHEEELDIRHLVLPQSEFRHNKSLKNSLPTIGSKQEENGNTEAPFESTLVRKLQEALQKDCVLHELLDEIEKTILIHALKRHNTVAQTHLALGLSRNAIDAKRKKYKI